MAVDLLGWNMMWPWPLPDRCHSSRAAKELQKEIFEREKRKDVAKGEGTM